jgi:hypothetical protein
MLPLTGEYPENMGLIVPPDYVQYACRCLARAQVADESQPAERPPLTKWPRSAEWKAYVEFSETRAENSLAAILFSALAVEAFLNTVGVARLGEKYYQKNCERLKVHEKLAFLVGTLGHKLVEPSDEIARALKRVFESRNRVAHPKTKQIAIRDSDLKFESQDLLKEAKGSVSAMLLFFREFLALVPKAKIHLRHDLTSGKSWEDEP